MKTLMTGRLQLSCFVASILSLAAACSSSEGGTSSGSTTTGRRPTSGGTATGSGGSGVGEQCGSDADCDGLTCFASEIPNGYCSSTCNTNADCPMGGSCVIPLPGQQICVLACANANACIRAGYGCDSDCSVC